MIDELMLELFIGLVLVMAGLTAAMKRAVNASMSNHQERLSQT